MKNEKSTKVLKAMLESLNPYGKCITGVINISTDGESFGVSMNPTGSNNPTNSGDSNASRNLTVRGGFGVSKESNNSEIQEIHKSFGNIGDLYLTSRLKDESRTPKEPNQFEAFGAFGEFPEYQVIRSSDYPEFIDRSSVAKGLPEFVDFFGFQNLPREDTRNIHETWRDPETDEVYEMLAGGNNLAIIRSFDGRLQGELNITEGPEIHIEKISDRGVKDYNRFRLNKDGAAKLIEYLRGLNSFKNLQRSHCK